MCLHMEDKGAGLNLLELEYGARILGGLQQTVERFSDPCA